MHWVTHRAGPARGAAQPGVRTRLPRTFRADGEEWVVWVTDAEGDDALEFAPATGLSPGATARRLAAGQLGRELALAMAPDGSRAAVASHDGRVLLVERETGEVREVDRSDNGDATGLVFSPDSAWLAWSHPRPRTAAPAQARQHHRPVGERGDPAALPRTTRRPILDGKLLAFLSTRLPDGSGRSIAETLFDKAPRAVFSNAAAPHSASSLCFPGFTFEPRMDGPEAN